MTLCGFVFSAWSQTCIMGSSVFVLPSILLKKRKGRKVDIIWLNSQHFDCIFSIMVHFKKRSNWFFS